MTKLERFSGQVRELADLLGLSQAEVARRVGMQASHLNVFLKGRGDLHSLRLMEILKELGIDLEEQLETAARRLRAKRAGRPLQDDEDLLASLQQISRPERESLRLIISRLRQDKRRSARRGLSS